MDEPLGIAGGFVDVGDALLRRSIRIDREVSTADEALISPDSPELVPFCKWEPLGDR
jgi:hypothetical protein